MEKNQNGYPVMPNASDNGNLKSPDSSSQDKGCPEKVVRDGNTQKRENGNCDVKENLCLDSMPLAYVYIPMQKFRMLYPADTALKNGTLFEELNLPMGVYSNE